LFLGGGLSTPSYGESYNHVRIPSGYAPTICSKKFLASAGHPYVSVMKHTGSYTPSGYTCYTSANLSGTNNYGYVQTSPGGFYLGGLDTWAAAVSATSYGDGYIQQRYTTSVVAKVCFKVMGVDEDAATAKGVYPVLLGLNNAAGCPGGWNIAATTNLYGSNSYTYNMYTSNASVFGGRDSWAHGGSHVVHQYFHSTHVPQMCWKYFTWDNPKMHPSFEIRTPASGSCPAGFASVTASYLKYSSTGYIQGTSQGLYIGGLNTDYWSTRDDHYGRISHKFTTNVANKVCIKINGGT